MHENESQKSQPFADPPMMLAVTDIAHHLRCSDDTIFRLISAGEFPKADFVRGRLRLWARETLAAWVDDQRRKTA